MTNLLDSLKEIEDLRQKKDNIKVEIENKELAFKDSGQYEGKTIKITLNDIGQIRLRFISTKDTGLSHYATDFSLDQARELNGYLNDLFAPEGQSSETKKTKIKEKLAKLDSNIADAEEKLAKSREKGDEK